MSEITDFATPLLIVAGGLLVAVVSTKLTARLPLPAPALFLVIAAVASDAWPAVYDAVPIRTVERLATVALIVILFNGGLEMGWRRFRASSAPILGLGLAGTFMTAAGLALVAHVALGLNWTVAWLLGAALAPTDPAVMFSVLGPREIRGRSGTILEGEAGVNDPAGIALMLGMIELATHPGGSAGVVVREFAVQMAVGAICGLIAGRALVAVLRRAHLPTEGLYPVFALMLACVLYAATALAHGSGFLAVFLAGMLLGDARLPYKTEIARFQASLASFAEVVVFVGLGATIHLASLSARDWLDGIVVFAVLAAVIRPGVVAALLGRATITRAERAFIAWSGLKGAVPILLAAFAVLDRAPAASHVYELVFVVVLLSVALQGGLVPEVARRLGIRMRERERLPWELSVRLAEEPEAASEFRVMPGSTAEGARIGELALGDSAWITMLLRHGAVIEPRASVELRAGDRLLVRAEADDEREAQRIFERAPSDD